MLLQEIVLIGLYLVVLIYSVMIHEVAHGWAALYLGDPTAKYAGRLNLNLKNHIDPVGSVIVPIFMMLISGFQFAFGWAKPVPYNPFNLRNQKYGALFVAMMGPITNIIIALVAALCAKLVPLASSVKVAVANNFNQWEDVASVIAGNPSAILFEFFMLIVFWNVLLAFFNLIPIPPLDGSKILYTLFPVDTRTQIFMEQFGFMILLGVILLFQGPISVFLTSMLNIFFRLAV